MEEAHGAREPHLRGAQDQHLAAHAAQFRQRVARGPAAAVDDRLDAPAVAHRRRRSARLRQAVSKRPRSARNAARGSRCPSSRKNRPRRNRPGELRLERGDPLLRQRAHGRACGRRSARSRPHRAAARRRACRCATTPGAVRLPPVDGAPAPSSHDLRRRALALAEGREHAAREPRGGGLAKSRGALDERRRQRRAPAASAAAQSPPTPAPMTSAPVIDAASLRASRPNRCEGRRSSAPARRSMHRRRRPLCRRRSR